MYSNFWTGIVRYTKVGNECGKQRVHSCDLLSSIAVFTPVHLHFTFLPLHTVSNSRTNAIAMLTETQLEQAQASVTPVKFTSSLRFSYSRAQASVLDHRQ